MKFLVINIKRDDEFVSILKKLNAEDINGIVLHSTSLHTALNRNSDEAVPIFGFLSKLTRKDFDAGHTLMVLIDGEKLEVAKKIVREVTNGLTHKGVMFVLPVEFYEGV